MCCAKRSLIGFGKAQFGQAFSQASCRRYLAWTVSILSVGASWMLSLPVSAAEAEAETVLERVARTGKLVAGARANTLPFSDYANNEWRGYAIDLIKRIQADLEAELRQPIALEIKEVGIDERTPQLKEGNVDIVCDATSFTRSRDLEIDFSVGYFQTGTQLLFNTAVETPRVTPYADSAFMIGVVANTTNQAVIERRLQIAQFVEFPDRNAGWAALQQGRIDALASDGVLLEAMQRSSQAPENFVIAPPQPYDQEIYACMLPPNQPEFQAVVNRSLLTFMQGALSCNPDDLQLLNNWFGDVSTNLQLSQLFQRQLKATTPLAQCPTLSPTPAENRTED